jgi:hypothetical protein
MVQSETPSSEPEIIPSSEPGHEAQHAAGAGLLRYTRHRARLHREAWAARSHSRDLGDRHSISRAACSVVSCILDRDARGGPARYRRTHCRGWYGSNFGPSPEPCAGKTKNQIAVRRRSSSPAGRKQMLRGLAVS